MGKLECIQIRILLSLSFVTLCNIFVFTIYTSPISATKEQISLTSVKAINSDLLSLLYSPPNLPITFFISLTSSDFFL